TRGLASRVEIEREAAAGNSLSRKELRFLRRGLSPGDQDLRINLQTSALSDEEVRRVFWKQQTINEWRSTPHFRPSKDTGKRHRRKMRRITALVDAASTTTLVFESIDGGKIMVKAEDIIGVRERAIEIATHAVNTRPAPSRNPSI